MFFYNYFQTSIKMSISINLDNEWSWQNPLTEYLHCVFGFSTDDLPTSDKQLVVYY
jgi:hypothetical protein